MAPKNPDSEPVPPSTFEGIWKVPTGFGESLRTAEGWLEAKKIDDNIGNLWRVHDRLYDLTKYIPHHPGGSHWIERTRGTDITEAFETAHVVNVSLVETTLAKYFVSEAKGRRLSPYTFESNGFYKTLKRKIEPILKEVGTGPTTSIKLMQDSMVVTFIVLGLLGTWLDLLALKILSGAILAPLLIGGHNFFHLRDNWRKYYYDLGLLSSYEWQILHALSHHLYPNTVMDLELDMFPTYQFLPNRPKTWLQKYGPPFYSHFLYLISFWIDFAKRVYGRKWRLENGIVLAELAILLFIAPTIEKGFWSWVIIHTTSSFVFLTQGANAAHHHPDIWHDGDETRPNPDFGLGQLDATRDRAGDLHQNTWVILCTFGSHCLHHLFPTVCHSKLHYLKPVFEQTLKEFSVECPLMYQWELYLGCFKQLARTETHKKFSEKKKD